jgi:mRNA-degrading endonuclease toxin of MazEF toxin-antitoxin module
MIISNQICARVIIAPIKSKASRIFQFEAPINLKGIQGKILLDQIRSGDKIRIDGKIGDCDTDAMDLACQALKLVLHLS